MTSSVITPILMSATDPLPDPLDLGAANLFQNCAQLQPGDSLLLVSETPELGWWDADLIAFLADSARQAGYRVTELQVGAPGNDRDERVQAAMQTHDCALFLARAGDQDRFSTAERGCRIVMCYARNRDMLASTFGHVAYPAMCALKSELDRIIAAARHIRITCPLGSDLEAQLEPRGNTESADVSVRRFPMGIVSPILAQPFSGKAVMAHYLTPTGSAVYEPAVLELETPATALLQSGRIVGFDGPSETVQSIEQHYQRVARQFDLEPFVVHSWHAGIHPGVQCAIREADNPDLWGNTVFNHPRYLHFHSCGVNAPGEISWMLRDHRVTLDGVPLWDQGELMPQNFPAAARCLEEWPELSGLYRHPDSHNREESA